MLMNYMLFFFIKKILFLINISLWKQIFQVELYITLFVKVDKMPLESNKLIQINFRIQELLEPNKMLMMMLNYFKWRE